MNGRGARSHGEEQRAVGTEPTARDARSRSGGEREQLRPRLTGDSHLAGRYSAIKGECAQAVRPAQHADRYRCGGGVAQGLEDGGQIIGS